MDKSVTIMLMAGDYRVLRISLSLSSSMKTNEKLKWLSGGWSFIF